jgi:hypothetical protein
MRFEVYAKYGNRWSYKGIYQARDSRLAAYQAQYSTGRNVLKVRPEDSRDKFLVYRITSAPTVTAG